MMIAGLAFAQSADVITELLDSEKASVGQVAYLCAVQQELIQDTENYDAAVSALINQGYLAEDTDPSEEITLGKTAYLLSKNWEIQGGLMFNLTNGSPRYAFKQFLYDGVIAKSSEPTSYVSGAEVLQLYSAGLSTYGGFNIKSVSMESE